MAIVSAECRTSLPATCIRDILVGLPVIGCECRLMFWSWRELFVSLATCFLLHVTDFATSCHFGGTRVHCSAGITADTPVINFSFTSLQTHSPPEFDSNQPLSQLFQLKQKLQVKERAQRAVQAPKACKRLFKIHHLKISHRQTLHRSNIQLRLPR